ncbi:MAG TPA: polysaccharide deacetylase family protein [Pseudolabrys sp.]|jgi:peptidoglycan/xylan/chitin deacetylase (PgdA/CDA1 family)|uniref:polysaccharide deacetylase family protein n=1 Tax=Pseudolabrys sp. TaxID=1960880 RepID=UPI002DDD2A8B|nr:polysaccharide deacetylase family protein [Pseudolabrys sp.]HEV2628145.1 polysaccharide deacetylase family protein [Pseudolabrys sp.]
MRTAITLAVAFFMAAGTAAWAEDAQAPAPAAPTQAKCDNPNALGVSRIVQIDTTGGPGFGFEHFKAYDFLKDKEVVLTFDDGPWPGNTPRVLKALADQCTKALFFPIGKHAGWHPEILKEVAAGGHTIGSHTWSHKDLSRLTQQEAEEEFEKGIAAVSIALGNKPVDAFFRFPTLRNPPDMMKYLAQRNVAVFSTDFDSFDFKMRRPEQVVKSVMSKLEKHGKGIILMHDFQHATSEALPEILKELKEGGYKVVQITGKTPIEPKKEYVDAVLKEMGGGLDEARPMSSVIKTISGN